MRRTLPLLSALGLALAACGLSVVGEEPIDDTVPDASPGRGPDGSPAVPPRSDGSAPREDGGSDSGPPPACAPETCGLPAASGGSELVLFGDEAAECPAGFISSKVVAGATAGSDACGCGPCKANVDCSSGLISVSYDSDDTSGALCSAVNTTYPANETDCKDLNQPFSGTQNVKVTPPLAIAGSCSAGPVAKRSAVTTTSKRLCEPSASACLADACTPAQGLEACLVSAGNVTCPPHAPNKTLIGDDFSLTCAACICSVTKAECTGTAHTFPDPDCKGASLSLPGGECKSLAGADVASVKWVPGAPALTCNTIALPPSVELTGVRTVCCP